jgi:hypothetical protein
LQRFFRNVEIAEGADQRREQVAPLRTAQAIEISHAAVTMLVAHEKIISGRTSIEP